MMINLPRLGARRRLSRAQRRGASAIEFALCLPVFCALIFGVIEYGWIFFQQANVIAAVREGARYSVTLDKNGTPAPDEAAIDRVKTTLKGVGYSDSMVAAATIGAVYTGASPEETITVSANVPYQAIIGIIPTPGTIHGEMTMILELQQ